jgi:hypothetical protein
MGFFKYLVTALYVVLEHSQNILVDLIELVLVPAQD